jgi:hypothetical protein
MFTMGMSIKYPLWDLNPAFTNMLLQQIVVITDSRIAIVAISGNPVPMRTFWNRREMRGKKYSEVTTIVRSSP